ncbi:putative glutamate/phenylalanine/leucine/valine dehydrogenase [Plasmopara halstedii]
MQVLLHLKNELPLSSFVPSTVAATCVKHNINTQEGIMRVTQCTIVSRAICLYFCGWQTLKRLIVKSANLFITPEACQLLFENANLVNVNDSLANTDGVGCRYSSFEIVVNMHLKIKKFLEVVTVVKESTSAMPPASLCINRAIIRMHDAMVAHFGDVFEKTSTFWFL